MKEGIYGFTTPQTRFLSNFWMVEFVYKNFHFTSSEHAYQARKMTNVEDFKKVWFCRTPGQAKRMGNSLPVREDWDSVKEEFMLEILRCKFRHPDMKKLLLDTGDLYLEETNTWNDTFWGVCNGKGLNKLGYILMQIREELRNEDSANNYIAESSRPWDTSDIVSQDIYDTRTMRSSSSGN